MTTEATQALNEIYHYIHMLLTDSSYDPHFSTIGHLNKIADICKEALEISGDTKDLMPCATGTIIVSCDASAKTNPGGPCACGVVIRFADPAAPPHKLARISPTATTINQAEYDAIYEGLSYFKTFGRHCATSIEVRTDSQLICNQLNGKWVANEKDLINRRDSVRELIDSLEEKIQIPITIKWYPRNSSEDLRLANNLAQDLLGVKHH